VRWSAAGRGTLGCQQQQGAARRSPPARQGLRQACQPTWKAMPTTLPPCSTGPPLLPLLMAASICSVSSEQRPCEYCGAVEVGRGREGAG
jgi:hypothetical protein